MALSKTLATHHLITICLFSCLYSTIYSQKPEDFVSLVILDNEHFSVLNKSDISFDIEFTDLEGKKIKKIVGITTKKSGEDKTKIIFSRKHIDKNSTLWLRYTLKSLEEQLSVLINQLIQLETSKDTSISLNKQLDLHRVLMYNQSISKPKTPSLKISNIIKFATTFKKTVSNWLKKHRKINEGSDAALICRDIYYWIDLYKNSNTDDPLFFNLPSELKSIDKHLEKEIIAKNIVSIGFPVLKSELGNNWDAKGNGFHNISYELQYSRLIWQGFRLGGNINFSFYAMINHDRNVYNIKNRNKRFYIGRDYVENASQNFTELKSDNDIALRTNQFGIGLLTRLNLFDNFHFNLGTGYYLSKWSSILFDRGKEHLSNNFKMRKHSISDVIDYNNSSSFYGIVGFSWPLIVNTNDNKVKALELFLRAKFWNSNLSPNNNFSIYQQRSSKFEKIAITNNKHHFYSINIGLDFTW